ncbi:Uncharacterized [Syntrophomonas zehnderi OL-4]|uniref:Uncharacterized n=1 Tax=Syntrophomonas zehnderi OL-4 TaxID=690567 RepID=A0A0E4C8W5_9FIRM|nr:Uncharacterized [Syntrophomonas zehnderi OL-4]
MEPLFEERLDLVAPRAGAWIETVVPPPILTFFAGSHPVRVRGLKPEPVPTVYAADLSHPVRVRGLKPVVPLRVVCRKSSHPVRVRGLKQGYLVFVILALASHPVRVRGLKRIVILPVFRLAFVAPRAGAWIETVSLAFTSSQFL